MRYMVSQGLEFPVKPDFPTPFPQILGSISSKPKPNRGGRAR